MSAGMSAFGKRMARALLAARTPLLMVLLVASLAAFAVSSWQLRQARRQNEIIRALVAGRDVAVDARTASDDALVARGLLLLQHDRMEEAQVLLRAVSARASAKVRARMLYNHANALVRLAIAAVEKGELDKPVALVALAKDQYRQALRIEPDAWDVKHNYDVALRLVRDFPGSEQEGEEPPPDGAKQLWTDLPGVPKGLP